MKYCFLGSFKLKTCQNLYKNVQKFLGTNVGWGGQALPGKQGWVPDGGDWPNFRQLGGTPQSPSGKSLELFHRKSAKNGGEPIELQCNEPLFGILNTYTSHIYSTIGLWCNSVQECSCVTYCPCLSSKNNILVLFAPHLTAATSVLECPNLAVEIWFHDKTIIYYCTFILL